MAGQSSQAEGSSQRWSVGPIMVLDFGFPLRLPRRVMSVGKSGQTNTAQPNVDAYYPTARLTYQSKVDDPYSSHSVILRSVGDGKGKRLLDVGSAQGVLAQKFTERGFEVTCIEGSPELAALGKDKCHEMIVADLDKPLPQLNGQFDVIVYGDILEHLRNPMEVFHRVQSLLAAGGSGDRFGAEYGAFVGAAELVVGPIRICRPRDSGPDPLEILHPLLLPSVPE